ncbi:MAG: carbohydrate kinase family protein [Woeseiaceae bacterium]
MSKLKILIIGGASLDKLAGAEQLVPGGAGMYTAMSAHRSGADVSLYAPCPDPIPDALHPVRDRLTWLGPSIAQADLAHFEILYEDGRANYVTAQFGTENTLSTDELPNDLSHFDCIHLVPLGDIRRQHAIMQTCRERGAQRISAGTALDLINEQPELAKAVLRDADILFMNEEEAIRQFASMADVCCEPHQLIYVTRGANGATVIQGEAQTELPGVEAVVVDPTGAGDTFCGATLVGIASGLHPVMAARRAMPLAAQMTEEIGPAALLRSLPTPRPALDERVSVNSEQVDQIAALIAAAEDITAFPFTGPDLPAVDHPAALDYFFATTLQQFGFWTARNDRYEQPMVATIDGEQRKGAFYLFRAYLRWLEHDPDRLAPAGQAALTKADLAELLRDDDDGNPMPALELHLSLAQQYGRDMLALELTTDGLLERVNAAENPLRSLLSVLDCIGGYKEDPLRKKASLLAIILQQRPERFLLNNQIDVPPVVDYHVMRSCLRTGLIDVTDESLSNKLVGRELLSDSDEWAIRSAAHAAVEQVVMRSGRSMGAVDWFFFQARKRCPEMSEPQCDLCAVDPACAHRKTLFQPVRRTSYY